MIYLDNAATSWPKPPEVIHAVAADLAEAGNPSRGGHRRSIDTQRRIDQARLTIARLLQVDDPRRVVFTLNGTDALNMAIRGVLAPLIESGRRPHVVSTVLEHNSINRPLNALSDRGAIALDRISCGVEGVLTADAFAAALHDDTALVAFTAVSNALGTIQPFEEIVAMVRRHSRASILIDGSQAAGALPLDLRSLDTDFLAAPGHKGLLGPTGTGLLYIGKRIVADPDDAASIRCFREGGTGGDSTNPQMPAELPHHLEGGTPNTSGIAGLGAGAAWVAARGVAAIREHERSLTRRLLEGLTRNASIEIIGPANDAARVGIVSVTVKGFDPADIAGILDASFEIAVRSGLHCAPLAHRTAGTFPAGTIRASVGPFTTADDIDRLIAALDESCR